MSSPSLLDAVVLERELEFDNAFQAHHLAVPIGAAVSVTASEIAHSAATRLKDVRFDQAPVVEEGRVLGFVLTRRLSDSDVALVEDVMVPLGSGNIVSANASIGRLMEWILDPGFLFVLEGREITGFITVSDFNKQPVRAYLYLLISRVELGIAELLRRRFANQDDVLALLSADKRRKAEERFNEDRRVGEESDIVAYLEFSDLVTVFGQDESSLHAVGFADGRRWKAEIGGLVNLRNEVMHPVRNVVWAKGGLIQLQAREQRLRRLIAVIDAAMQPNAVPVPV